MLILIHSGFKSFRKLSTFAGRILWIGNLRKTGLDQARQIAGRLLILTAIRWIR
ncbi:hypothetical protein [Coprobacter fastidiosus]|uniref:hypothetical protein n=1 Tax=Coprobacter fastidiosus TaxID=1099853 RepID=UPI003AB3D4FA